LIWLYAFMSCRALFALSGFLLEQVASGQPVDPNAMRLTAAEAEAFERYKGLLSKASELRFAGTILDMSWPDDVPKPTRALDRATLSTPDQTGYDLAHFGYAYAILHEIQHVKFSSDGNAPAEPVDEEIACDKFAFEFVLAKIPEYAIQTRENELLVRRKRAASLMLVMSLPLGVADPDYWSETPTHPSVRRRLELLAAELDSLPANDDVWLYGSAVVLARLLAVSSQSPIQATTARNLFRQLLAKI
jgi:hypothetical protein